jgi:hypothetical protein
MVGNVMKFVISIETYIICLKYEGRISYRSY